MSVGAKIRDSAQVAMYKEREVVVILVVLGEGEMVVVVNDHRQQGDGKGPKSLLKLSPQSSPCPLLRHKAVRLGVREHVASRRACCRRKMSSFNVVSRSMQEIVKVSVMQDVKDERENPTMMRCETYHLKPVVPAASARASL